MTTAQLQLLYLWITFTVMAVLGIAAVLVWAVRSGQFSDQDRARRLPLLDDVPEDDAAPEAGRHSKGKEVSHVPP